MPRWSPDGKQIAVRRTNGRAASSRSSTSRPRPAESASAPGRRRSRPDSHRSALGPRPERSAVSKPASRAPMQMFRVDLERRASSPRSPPASAPSAASTSTKKAGVMTYLANDFRASRRSLCRRARRQRRAPAHAPQREALVGTRPRQRRAPALQEHRRLGHRRLSGEAGRLAAGQEISDDPEHSRRPGRAIRRRLVSRIPGLRRQGLGRVLLQSARFHRLRPEIRARHRQQLGRHGLPGRHGRRGRRAQAKSVDRSRIAWASPAAATAAS